MPHDQTVPLPDGTALAAGTHPVPAGVARRGALLVVHGLGEHGARYARLGEELAALGLETWTYDHRGHGASPGARGVLPEPDTLLDDLGVVFAALAAGEPEGPPPFLLGHSLGGAVAARAATGGWVTPRGLILSSPALRLRLTPAQRALVAVLARVAPQVTRPNALETEALSHDPDVVAAYRDDPLVHDQVSARMVRALQQAGEQAIRDAPRLTVPTLLLVSGADRIVDPAGARAFAAALPATIGTVRWYDDLYHEVVNEREEDRARVLADLVAWLEARLG